ncbi:MAG: dGTP triphosphohydrolase [Planctomycetota bacterium]
MSETPHPVEDMPEEIPSETTERSESRQLEWIDERESILLAPYAMHSADSKGRAYPESEHPYRGPFQRDRDRILHSSAFRRLRGKMQVFTGEMGDYHRTRLTHTQEVATIARTIGRVLMLNEDLIEALALVHDIGHPPYGHAGEDELDECIKDLGGFSHNQFALTIVQELEVVYPEFPGLNLTHEVLTGQTARVDKDAAGPRPLLEVQLVDAADSTTYDAHDTDDAIKLGLVSMDEMAELELVGRCLKYARENFAALDEKLMRRAVVHRLINIQVTDMLTRNAAELQDRGFESASQAMESDFLIGPGKEMGEQKRELESFLYERVYRHPDLVEIRNRAQSRLRECYEVLSSDIEFFPGKYQPRAREIGCRKMAVEYIAGMTDNFFEQTYRRLTGKN